MAIKRSTWTTFIATVEPLKNKKKSTSSVLAHPISHCLLGGGASYDDQFLHCRQLMKENNGKILIRVWMVTMCFDWMLTHLLPSSALCVEFEQCMTLVVPVNLGVLDLL